MSDDENFLARWSRRKREEAKAAQAPAGLAQPVTDEPDANRSPGAVSAIPPTEAAEWPVFDPATLPPIDSITAATDVRPFLMAGVPEELKHAALRRAWLADPTIRSFIGVAENQWDFTVSGGAPGFGSLLPTDDVQQLVARVLGAEPDRQAEQLPPQGVTRETVAQVQKETQESSDPRPREIVTDPANRVSGAANVRRSNESSEEEFVMAQKGDGDNCDIAMQNDSTGNEGKIQSGQRKHGSALPK
jgi:hypothetical protein